MTTKKKVGWSDLKAQLVGLEKTELLQLVKDLYSSSKDVQQFLHARYAMGGGDVLAPYKDTITQWIGVVAQMPVAAEVGSGDERDELGSG